MVPVVHRGEVPRCEDCGGVYKPAITFFGEMLPAGALETAGAWAAEADLMLVLGSSLVVQPAAGLPWLTLRSGGRVFPRPSAEKQLILVIEDIAGAGIVGHPVVIAVIN